jgi:GTPase SAR1 family protein
VLCGNKYDLLQIADDYVTQSDAQKIAKDHDMRYFETSAFTGKDVKEMIEFTIEQVYEKKIKPALELEK